MAYADVQDAGRGGLAAGAGDRVLTGLQVDGERAREAGDEVLLLAQNARAREDLELADAPGSAQDAYVDAAVAEVRLARRVLGEADLPVRTVFFGGGTPTLLPVADLGAMLIAVRDLEPLE